MSKTGKTVALRTTRFRKWVQRRYLGSTTIQHQHLTSENVAAQASAELGFPVSPNRAAREMYRQGINFRRVPADPPEPAWSKNELNRTRMDYLEKRIRVLERAVLGRTRKKFEARSQKELRQRAKKTTGPAATGSDPQAGA